MNGQSSDSRTEDSRQRIIEVLAHLASGHRVTRVWGRLADATPEQAQEGNAWAADVDDVADLVLNALGIPTVRLVATSEGQHIEVWHVPQPERYHVTRETWAEEPGQMPVRHIHAVREASTG
jgi:hypothetical protein